MKEDLEKTLTDFETIDFTSLWSATQVRYTETEDEKLEKIDIATIEKFLRKKKLEKINKTV